MLKTIDPANPSGPRIEAVLPGRLIEQFYKHMPVRYQNLKAAKHVLDKPDRIFFGVREYNEGGRCYVGRPTSWFIRERVEAPFPEDKIFAVYVNPRMRIYECRAELVAGDDPMSPKDWEKRYRGLVWKSTS